MRAYSFSAKREHLNPSQRQAAVDEELLKASDELMLIIRHNPILQSLSEHIDNPNFLWDSTFIETLCADEKKKYAKFDASALDITAFADSPQIYDTELPYFSSVVEYATHVHYIGSLKKLVHQEDSPKPPTPEEPEIKAEAPEQPRHFEADFED